MAYVEGGDLSVVVEDGRLDRALALEVAAQAAAALRYAHTKRVIHRDMKPGNILVRDLNERPHVYVSDFGIGKLLEDEAMTQSLVSPRTPLYGAPEQFVGGESTEATDVCGLARTLYHLVTGERPPAEGRALPLNGMEPALADLLRRATERPPERRPTMTEMERALRRLAKDEAPVDHPTLPTRHHIYTAPRRRVLAAVTVLAGGLVLLGGFAVGDGDEQEPPSAPPTRVESASPLRIPYTAPWRTTTPSSGVVRDLGLKDPSMLSHGATDALLFGRVADARPGADPLTATARRALGIRGRPRAVRIGELQALEYRGEVPGDPSTLLYLSPTTAGWMAFACRAPAARLDGFRSSCEDRIARAGLEKARPATLAPDTGYAQTVSSALGSAAQARRRAGPALRSSSLAKRARAAARVSDAYSRAASRVGRETVRLQDRAGDREVQTALRNLAKAFAALGDAATRKRAAAYRAAADDVSAGDRRLLHALQTLEASGYGITTTAPRKPVRGS
jgi:hypothetical protein